MPDPSDRPESLDLSRLILLVTGSHPDAEFFDRPIAYRLRAQLIESLAADFPAPPHEVARRVLVISDVWYLSHDHLRALPTISIGNPAVNALSAYLGDKVPGAFAVHGVLLVQLDIDFDDLTCCCWGKDHQATSDAVDAFAQRYLADYTAACARRWDTL